VIELNDETEIRSDIAAAAAGDGQAYARIIDRFRPLLTARMRRFANSAADIDELVHDVFVEAYFSLDNFRGDSPFEHWLQRIATRVGYRRWKQNRKRGQTAPLPPDVADRFTEKRITEITAAEADEALSALLAKLSPRDRLVVTLLHVEGRTVEETAAMTGWSKTMVKVQAFRARAKLKKLLDADVL
jgi:RNA polymerase sigma-70 factor (ECF subfamily)